MNGGSRSLHGFTLVELLVVMGIISLLAGLLLPVLEESIDAARDVACRSNLKQIGTGHLFYANDFDEWMIWYSDWFRAPRDLGAMDYVPSTITSNNAAPKLGEAYGTVWDCPASSRMPDDPGVSGDPYGKNQYTYAYNMEGSITRYGVSLPLGVSSILGYRAGRPQPYYGSWGVNQSDKVFARTLWTCESVGHRYRVAGRHEGRAEFQLWPHPGGSANYLYMDGEVEGQRPPDPYHPFSPWAGTGWNAFTKSMWSKDNWRINVLQKNPHYLPDSW